MTVAYPPGWVSAIRGTVTSTALIAVMTLLVAFAPNAAANPADGHEKTPVTDVSIAGITLAIPKPVLFTKYENKANGWQAVGLYVAPKLLVERI